MTKPIPELTAKQQACFWAHVDVRGPDECWLWTAGRGKRGYGQFSILTWPYSAHRVSMSLNGRDPLELNACHTCDNPPCCNPAHLFAGSDADNMADRDAKLRTARGDRVGIAKLTEDSVRAIRRDPRPLRVVAVDYGVGYSTIGKIKQRKLWRHVA